MTNFDQLREKFSNTDDNRLEILNKKIDNLPNLYKKPPEILSASFLVTENCSLNCTYCFEKHNKNKMTNETAIQAVKFLFNNSLKENKKPVHIMLFGGEPTLLPNTLDLILTTAKELSFKHNINFTSSIVTNATIMGKKLYNMYKKHKDILSVQLSIDGIKKAHDMYRVTKNGNGSFDIIEKNIPYYKELYKNNYKQLTVHGCLNKKTLPYLYESFKQFRIKWGIEKIWFLPIMEEEWNEKDVEIYFNENFKIYNWIINQVEKTKSIEEIKNYAPMDRCFMSGYMHKPCGAGEGYVTITANGEIYPCHQIYFNDINKETLIGDIWNGIDNEKRRLFIEYDAFDLDCPSTCTHGLCYRCIAVNWNEYKTILSQIQGNYCKLMKIDQYFQNKLKQDVERITQNGIIK